MKQITFTSGGADYIAEAKVSQAHKYILDLSLYVEEWNDFFPALIEYPAMRDAAVALYDIVVHGITLTLDEELGVVNSGFQGRPVRAESS